MNSLCNPADVSTTVTIVVPDFFFFSLSHLSLSFQVKSSAEGAAEAPRGGNKFGIDFGLLVYFFLWYLGK